jgi:uncharacterized repeat protein (TIGR02543 family)
MSIFKHAKISAVVTALLLAVSLSPLAVAPAANAAYTFGASSTPFDCPSNFFQTGANKFYAFDGTVTPKSFVLGPDNATAVGTGTLNGMGYNPGDNYLWGTNGTKFFRIGQDGKASTSFTPVAGSVTPQSTGGDFYTNDLLINAANTTWTITNVNSSNVVGDIPAQKTVAMTLATGSAWAAFDMAIEPRASDSGNYHVYGLQMSSTTINFYRGTISKTGTATYTANPAAKTITLDTNILGTTTAATAPASGDNFGAAYADVSGDVYFWGNNSKKMYRIASADLDSAGAIKMAQVAVGATVTPTSPNDGASCRGAAAAAASSPITADINVYGVVGSTLNVDATHKTGNTLPLVASSQYANTHWLSTIGGTAIAGPATRSMTHGTLSVTDVNSGYYSYSQSSPLAGVDSITYAVNGTGSSSESNTSNLNIHMLGITSTNPTSGAKNVSYGNKQQLASGFANGSTVTWALTSGALPSGMTLSTTGMLSGTPTQSGTFTFTVSVTDPVTGLVATQTTTLVIADSAGALKYTVSFDPKGGTPDPVDWTQPNTSADSLDLTDAGHTPTKANYTFAGWTSVDGSDSSIDITDPAHYTPIENVTLFAIWKPAFVVTYNGNFNTSGSAPSAATFSGAALTLAPANGMSKTHYTFDGWSLSDQDIVKLTGTFTPTGPVTLYAIWVTTVTFDANGGTGSPTYAVGTIHTLNVVSVNFGDDLVLPTEIGMTAPTGKFFRGWGAATSSTSRVADPYTPVGGETLYAIWGAAAVFTVGFDPLGGGPTPATQTQASNGASIPLPTSGVSLTGYTFDGWSANNGGTTPEPTTYTPLSDITLYAIWTPVVVQTPPVLSTPPTAKPTITVPPKSTIGTTPVTLTPTITAPGGIGHRCLVDPADNVCKQSVTLPGKGKFVLNSNGTVTFTAVLGWTGTATVQYRVTDEEGQSAEAPVTVTVVPPAVPSVTGGSGNTITTVPANVTPQVNGLGSICLIDPADNGCKQTVTIPGKGTFVLNSNGTVTFTAVAGFIGTVTVQLQITTAYGQVARGPVTFIVGPTSQLQTGATTGTTPVNLAPNTKPEPGSACLVDPSDDGCKNVVTIPEVGTWNLNPSTGSVTFKAVTGYVGTTIVQYRIKRAGLDATLTPFVVTVAKKRAPVTVTIGGFKPGSPILTAAIKNQVAAFMKAYVGYKTIECIGFTMGPTVLSVDKWLSTTRASNACGFILGALKSKVTALPLKNKMETTLGSSIRRITLTLRD